MSDKKPTTPLDDVDYGGLENSSGFLIRIAQVYIFESFYEALGKYRLQPGSISVLILIESNPGIRHGVLAQALSIKLAHMTKMIKAFEAKGFVTRNNPASDRRSVELTLTQSGREFVEEMRPLMFAHDTSRPDGLNNKERQQLNQLLRKFVKI